MEYSLIPSLATSSLNSLLSDTAEPPAMECPLNYRDTELGNPRAPSQYWTVHHSRRSARWIIENSNPSTRENPVPTGVSINWSNHPILATNPRNDHVLNIPEYPWFPQSTRQPKQNQPKDYPPRHPTQRSVRQPGRSVRQHTKSVRLLNQLTQRANNTRSSIVSKGNSRVIGESLYPKL